MYIYCLYQNVCTYVVHINIYWEHAHSVTMQAGIKQRLNPIASTLINKQKNKQVNQGKRQNTQNRNNETTNITTPRTHKDWTNTGLKDKGTQAKQDNKGSRTKACMPKRLKSFL